MRFPSLKRSTIFLFLVLLGSACTSTPDLNVTAEYPLESSTPEPTLTIPPTGTSTETQTPTSTAVPFTPTPQIDITAYARECERADRLNSETERAVALEGLTFPTELSAEAQSLLASSVIVKPSCNVRPENIPQYIVLHATRGGLVASVAEFQGRHNSSAHYIIDRDGQVYQMVPERLVAFHVTCCLAQGGRVVQDYTQSVGIELVNKLYINPEEADRLIFEDYLESFGYRYWEDYPQEQLASLVVLVEDISARWNIPMENLVGHYKVNDTVDPGPALNLFWRRNGNPNREPIFVNP